MQAFRSLRSEHWKPEHLQLCQATIWDTLTGASSTPTVDIANRVVVALEGEDEDVMVISANSAPASARKSIARDDLSTQSQPPRMQFASPEAVTKTTGLRDQGFFMQSSSEC